MSEQHPTQPPIIARGVPFTQLPDDVITDTVLTPAQFRVYSYLMMRANSEGRTWPSHRTIARDIGINKSTVASAIDVLRSEGWISVHVERDQAVTGHKQRHSYVVFGTRPAHLFTETVRVNQPVGSTNRSDNATGTVRIEDPDRTDEPYITTSIELQPELHPIAAKPRNVGWDFFTDPQGFNLPTGTVAQKKRIGRLAREVNATMEHNHITSLDDLNSAALAWPKHFPDATLTPEAYAKHLPALLAAPLRGSRHAVKQATRAADDQALAARLAEVVP